MESVTVKVNVLFGSKSSDEVRTVVILLYLSRDFTLEELKSSLFRLIFFFFFFFFFESIPFSPLPQQRP